MGTPIPDGAAESFVQGLNENERDAKDPESCVTVSTANVITAARTLWKEGHLAFRPVFIFEGQEIIPDDKGRLSVWPRGFCDHEMNRLERLA